MTAVAKDDGDEPNGVSEPSAGVSFSRRPRGHEGEAGTSLNTQRKLICSDSDIGSRRKQPMPETEYAESNGISIAYQVIGSGPVDIVVAPGLFSHVELYNDFPDYHDFFRRLSSFARVIIFDKRGQGLSDRIDGVPTFEERLDDLLTVMQATSSERATIFGLSEGASMALLFAATHPDRVSHVITFSGYAKSCSGSDFPHMPSHEQRTVAVNSWLEHWGKGLSLDVMVPKLADNQAARRLFGRIERASMSPSAMRRYIDINLEIDVRDVLPAVHVPVLVMHHEDDRQVPFANAKYLADNLPNATLVNCGSGGHYYWSGDNVAIVGKIREFLSASKSNVQAENRVLATVLFTDIVGSTDKLSDVGDAAWRSTLDRHDSLSRDLVELHHGNLIRSTGDGVLATFDSPGRAVECACRLTEEVQSLGVQLRAGLHTGEIEIRGNSIDGIAVHVTARIEASGQANQVVVSQTVKDLMVGSTVVEFSKLGSRELKGISGQWTLYLASV